MRGAHANKSSIQCTSKDTEEPPAMQNLSLLQMFIKIPPTIISRCQRFDFNRISSTDIIQHLNTILEKEKIIFDDESVSLFQEKQMGA